MSTTYLLFRKTELDIRTHLILKIYSKYYPWTFFSFMDLGIKKIIFCRSKSRYHWIFENISYYFLSDNSFREVCIEIWSFYHLTHWSIDDNASLLLAEMGLQMRGMRPNQIKLSSKWWPSQCNFVCRDSHWLQ